MSENVFTYVLLQEFYSAMSYIQVFKPFCFVYGVWECPNLIDLHVAVHVPRHHMLKTLPFLQHIFWSPLLQTNRLHVHGFTSGVYSVPLIYVSIFNVKTGTPKKVLISKIYLKTTTTAKKPKQPNLKMSKDLHKFSPRRFTDG